MPRPRAGFAAFLLLVASAGPSGCGGSAERATAPPAAPPDTNGMALGFNQSTDARTTALQARTGALVRRFKVPWNDVEPASGRWSWTAYDAKYRGLLAAGLKPLLLAIGAPCWARGGSLCVPGPPDPSFDGAWKEYVRRLVERYPAAVGLEVWNEPNITPMFPPYPDPARFSDLLRAAYDAAKGVDSGLPVISGGLFATDRTGPFGIADSRFLAAMYAAGAGDSINAIGAHPYPMTAGGPGAPRRYDLTAMEHALDRLRAVRDDTGHSRTPIWVTEAGVSTASASGYPPGATEAEQARLLIEMIRTAQQDGDIQLFTIHNLIDSPGGGATPLSEIQSGFGVFDSAGRPKPAACVLSDALGGTLSCRGVNGT